MRSSLSGFRVDCWPLSCRPPTLFSPCNYTTYQSAFPAPPSAPTFSRIFRIPREYSGLAGSFARPRYVCRCFFSCAFSLVLGHAVFRPSFVSFWTHGVNKKHRQLLGQSANSAFWIPSTSTLVPQLGAAPGLLDPPALPQTRPCFLTPVFMIAPSRGPLRFGEPPPRTHLFAVQVEGAHRPALCYFFPVCSPCFAKQFSRELRSYIVLSVASPRIAP